MPARNLHPHGDFLHHSSRTGGSFRTYQAVRLIYTEQGANLDVVVTQTNPVGGSAVLATTVPAGFSYNAPEITKIAPSSGTTRAQGSDRILIQVPRAETYRWLLTVLVGIQLWSGHTRGCKCGDSTPKWPGRQRVPKYSSSLMSVWALLASRRMHTNVPKPHNHSMHSAEWIWLW